MRNNVCELPYNLNLLYHDNAEVSLLLCLLRAFIDGSKTVSDGVRLCISSVIVIHFCGYKFPTGKVGMLCANNIFLCGSVCGCNSVVDMDSRRQSWLTARRKEINLI
jgi:hypothetical protein